MRRLNYWGIVYNSVRHQGGQCIAALRPPTVSIPVQGSLLEYAWDGNRVISVCEKSEPLLTFNDINTKNSHCEKID